MDHINETTIQSDLLTSCILNVVFLMLHLWPLFTIRVFYALLTVTHSND